MPLKEHASLLIPDLPGFGKSDPVTGQFSMRGIADDLAEFLKVMDIPKAVFCGLSMGGYIGWEFAKNHNELLAGLICCNSRATADDELTARAREVAAVQVINGGTDSLAVTMKEKLFSTHTKSENTELLESVAGVIRNTRAETVAAAQRGMAIRHDFSKELSEFCVRTLVVAGTEDVITPSDEMQEMSFLLEQSTFVAISEAGHLSPAEHPEVFNHAVVHWLS
jgi:pimeloyl-ACP methyl ester carboxylesterase